jgi:hypothetical protein
MRHGGVHAAIITPPQFWKDIYVNGGCLGRKGKHWCSGFHFACMMIANAATFGNANLRHTALNSQNGARLFFGGAKMRLKEPLGFTPT